MTTFDRLPELVDAGFPLVWVRTGEPEEVERYIEEVRPILEEGTRDFASLVDPDGGLEGETANLGLSAEAVEEANRAVSRAEQIRRFRILPGDFTEEGGELTPSLKVKRAVVLQRYADDVAALYAGVTQPA